VSFLQDMNFTSQPLYTFSLGAAGGSGITRSTLVRGMKINYLFQKGNEL
jgi:hypothetical protein